MKGWPIIKAAGFDITFPDLVTSLNLVSGILAVYSAIMGELLTAKALVAAGLLFDLFDGRFARQYGQSHPFGRELDSLADLVTFGVAPGVILLLAEPSGLLLGAVAVYGVAAAFRLARFNIMQEAKASRKGYSGVPVPLAAFIALALSFIALPTAVMGVLLIGLAALMVSTVRIPKL